jgi:hypothetical protein
MNIIARKKYKEQEINIDINGKPIMIVPILSYTFGQHYGTTKSQNQVLQNHILTSMIIIANGDLTVSHWP